MWPFIKQLFQAPLLLRELVIDLPDVHRFQIGVTVAGVGLADVYKQVLVELETQKTQKDTYRVCSSPIITLDLNILKQYVKLDLLKQ